MKLRNLIALVGLVALFTGCSKDEGSILPTPDGKPTTFTINVNGASSRTDAPPSRAAADAPTRYIIEYYEGKTPLATDAVPIQHIEQDNGSFIIFLKDNADYTVLFWADYDTPNDNANNIFNAADLKKVSINPTKKADKPAWSGMEEVATGGPDDNNKDNNITLTHAVAQVCFKQIDEMNFAQANGNLLKVQFPQTYSLNVADRTATEIKDGGGNSVPCEVEFTVEGTAKNLGALHIIARGDGEEIKTMMDITTEFKASATATPEAVKSITNIPLRANYKTNITGAYSDIYTSAVSVTCDENWENTYTEDFPRLAEVGNFYYKDGSYGRYYINNPDNPCIGIVFWVNPLDKTHGKIMSLDEPEGLKWGKPNFSEVGENHITSLSSYDDGEEATRDMIKFHKNVLNEDIYFATVYSIFHYVYQTKNNGDINGRWYIPALHELQHLLCARKGSAPKTWGYDPTPPPFKDVADNAAFKNAMKTANATPFYEDKYIPKGHWATTENTVENYIPELDETFYNATVHVQYDDGSFEPYAWQTDGNRLLRCISKF